MLTFFNKIVLLVATIVLIIMLILLYFFLSKSLFEDSYPPIISDCPDYWDISLNSNQEKVCIDNLKINSGLGTSYCNKEKDVSFFKLIGTDKDDIICQKYKWAKDCQITWDGITNNTKKCRF